MIFVTVGTSLPHDELIETIDKLVSLGKVTDDVIAQIGNGNYIPKHIKSFRFRKGIDKYLRRAEIVISNCGAGTIMENVTKGRKLVVIQNPDITGGHEWELVSKMEKGGHLIWCRNLGELLECIERASSMQFMQFKPKRLSLQEVIRQIMSS